MMQWSHMCPLPAVLPDAGLPPCGPLLTRRRWLHGGRPGRVPWTPGLCPVPAGDSRAGKLHSAHPPALEAGVTGSLAPLTTSYGESSLWTPGWSQGNGLGPGQSQCHKSAGPVLGLGCGRDCDKDHDRAMMRLQQEL